MSNTPNCGAEDTIGCVCGYCAKPQANKTISEILGEMWVKNYDIDKAKQQIQALITEAERKARSKALRDMTIWANMEMANQLKEKL